MPAVHCALWIEPSAWLLAPLYSRIAPQATRRHSKLDDEHPEPLVIPHTELSADALRSVVESFVLREGTEYGAQEFSLEQKVAHVMRQLERGEAQVVFDMNTETVDIMATHSRFSRQG